MYLRYLWQVIRHKWYVFLEAWKLGVPWLGLVHDWSKFLPWEFGPYARQFYGPHQVITVEAGHDFSRGDVLDIGGYRAVISRIRGRELIVVTLEQKGAFDVAWNHHQKSNKHHWQYWVLVYDHPDAEAEILLDMPMRYRMEMLADWRGAGRAYGTPDTEAWYAKHRGNQRVHPETRRWLDEQLGWRPGC